MSIYMDNDVRHYADEVYSERILDDCPQRFRGVLETFLPPNEPERQVRSVIEGCARKNSH